MSLGAEMPTFSVNTKLKALRKSYGPERIGGIRSGSRYECGPLIKGLRFCSFGFTYSTVFRVVGISFSGCFANAVVGGTVALG